MSAKEALGPRRWVARAATDLTAALGVLQAEPEALRDGRVFVNGRRQDWPGDVELAPGSVLEVYPSRHLSGAPIAILDQRDGLVVAFKPCELPTEPDRQGSASLITTLAQQLEVSASSLHACSRLDVGVSGAVVVALQRTAREYVQHLREVGGYRRRYLGIVPGCPKDPSGVWQQQLQRQRSRPTKPGNVQTLAATTHYRLLAVPTAVDDAARAADAALLELLPETGRKHQLRQHCASAGLALYGDRRFGGPTRIVRRDGSVVSVRRIALHAADVFLGVAAATWHITAPTPADFVAIWSALGGKELP